MEKKMISYNDVIQTVNDCAAKLAEIGDFREQKELRKTYKEVQSEAERAKTDDIIWIREFYEQYINKTQTEIEFEIDQSYFEKYIGYVRNALSRL